MIDKKRIYETLNKAYFSEEPDEKNVIDNLPELLNEAKVFVDIGASLGQYTFHANKLMRNGKIFAIEADPIRFEKLESNCKEWQASSTNELIAVNAAISDQDGQIKFYTTNSEVSGGLFKHPLDHLDEKLKENVQWEGISVECFKLDTLFKDITPEFIKMDVEGVELRVIRGCQNILKKGNVCFLIELHHWEDPEGQKNYSQVVDLMRSFGYNSLNFHGKTLFIRKSRFLILIRRLMHFLKGNSKKQ